MEPFIKKYHRHGNYVFWPDLASSHYAKNVIGHLYSKKINFVPKWLNPKKLEKLPEKVRKSNQINNQKNELECGTEANECSWQKTG